MDRKKRGWDVVRDLEKDFRRVPEEWKPAVLAARRWRRRMRRLATQPVRVRFVGEEK